MQIPSEIILQEQITGDIFRMYLYTPDIACSAKPGQFVHVRIRAAIDPLLRRPFSIHRVSEDGKQIVILYRVIGQGTEIMSRMQPGESLDLMGPLGNGFKLNQDFTRALIVAGGMGSAPIFFLMDELIRMKKQIVLFWGVREGKEIFQEDKLRESGIDVRIASEDASKGHCGFVTELLTDFLKNHEESGDMGFVCGPECMIHEVQKIVHGNQKPWQASLEERMACGVGVCLGCAVSIREKGYQMVCHDGPVFSLEEIQFHG